MLRYNLLPLARHEQKLVLACEDPFNEHGLDIVRFHTGMKVCPVLVPGRDILRLVQMHYSQVQDEAVLDRLSLTFNDIQDRERHLSPHARSLEKAASQRPVVQLLNSILLTGIIRGASDINIRPLLRQVNIHYRIDGRMQFFRSVPSAQLNALVSRIKIISGMDISERRIPQDGHAQMKRGQKSVDLRVSVIPVMHGESVVIRILDRDQGLRPFDETGFSRKERMQIRRSLKHSSGLFLVTGPTGSGKSTTMYALLNELKQEDYHILTVEDPVEYEMTGIEQVQVNMRKGVGFANVLRHFLRHDPDVLMVGEIRDDETADIACRAALTGHLVISTLHTEHAPAALMRLRDMGVEPYVLSSVLRGVVAQRLVRLLCPHCRTVVPADRHNRTLPGLPETVTLYTGAGCEHCHGSGYQGRRLVSEVLTVTDDLRRMIDEQVPLQTLSAVACQQGMQRLESGVLKLVVSGMTSIEEALVHRPV